MPILMDFLKAYPDIDVSLILNNSVQSLFQEQIDVGLRIGALPDSSMMAGTFREISQLGPNQRDRSMSTTSRGTAISKR